MVQKVVLSSSAPGRFLENPLHNAGTNPKLLPDLVDAIAFVPQLPYARFDRRFNPPASQLHSVGSSSGQPCIYPFANNAPLKLGENSEHLKHGLARRCRRIEPLLMKK